MSATAARTSAKPNAVAQPKALPPARSFAKQTRAAGRTFTRVGGKVLRGERQRFALPKEFRRSAANHSAVPSFSSQAKPVLVDTVISGARFIDYLPQRENTQQAVALHPWQQDIAGAHRRPPTVIQFAQLPQNTVVVPPPLPIRRLIGKGVTTHELKRFDSMSITSTGSPLPVAVRNPLARTFSVDLTPIRVHTDASAQRVVRSLNTRAFAYGSHIFLGPGEQPTDLRLMAHEVAHVVQQAGGVTLQHFTPSFSDPLEHEAERASAAAVRGERFNVQHHTSPRPQGFLKEIGIDIDIPDPLDWLAGKANMINGFRMFTIVLGVNPINMSKVDRSAANILRALIEFLPGGGFITQALDNSGVFEKAGTFVEQQIKSLGMTGEAIKSAVTQFIARLSLKRIVLEPGNVWEEAKSIFSVPIDRIISFASGLVGGIIDLIKEAILKPIAKLAEGTEGYNLLKGILGEDPITGESVTPSAETLLGPLLNMIGLGDVWQKMQQAKATSRAWAWFKTTMSQLRGFVSQIPGLFIAAFKALTIEDIVLVPKAFEKLRSIFGGFIGKFVSWGLEAMFKLLEIVFDVVKPGAMAYVKKTGAALKNILQNPLPFVSNLAKAAKLGFENFGNNFVGHLKKGLIDWLTGSLEGIYIPKALSLPEFGKLAISVLGITWAQIRGKIVKALGPHGETIMAGLEAVFDVVLALKDGGPAAAWEVIKDKLTGLKDTIVQGIISMVKEAVVTKAIPKLIGMFIPGAGFITAIVSIYDIVMVFVNKISKIAQVVGAFINSIVAIAAGNIGAAAGKVESILGNLLSLAISFLAQFAGLGKVSAKIRDIVKEVRATVDKAIETAVQWIINKAKSLFRGLFSGRKDAKPGDAKDPAAVKAKVRKDLAPRLAGISKVGQLQAILNSTYAKYAPEGLKRLEVKRLGNKAVFDVIAYASSGTSAGQVKAVPKLIAADLIPEQRMTVLLYSINGVDKGRVENNEDEEETGKRQHAEMIMRDRLKGEWKEISKTKPAGKHSLVVHLTRSPCGVCAGALQSFIAKYDIHLTLRLLSLYKGKAGGGPRAAKKALKDLMLNPDVDVQRWDAWAFEELRRLGLVGQIPKDLELRLSQRLGDLIIEMDKIKTAAAGGK